MLQLAFDLLVFVALALIVPANRRPMIALLLLAGLVLAVRFMLALSGRNA